MPLLQPSLHHHSYTTTRIHSLELLLELALPLVGEILEKLGGKAPLKLSREDFAPLCFI